VRVRQGAVALERDLLVPRLTKALRDEGPQLVTGPAGSGGTSLLDAVVHDAAAGRDVVRVRPSAWAREPFDQVEGLALVRPGTLVGVDNTDLLTWQAAGVLARTLEETGADLLAAGETPGHLLRELSLGVTALPGLSRAEVAMVSATATGEPVAVEGVLAMTLHRASGGRFSALTMLLEVPALLSAVRELAAGDPERAATRAPTLVPAWLGSRLDRADAEVRLAVAATVLADRDAPLLLLEAAVGTEQLREAADLGLLVRRGIDYAPAYAEVRRAVAQMMSPPLRVAAAQRLSEAADVCRFSVRPRLG